MKSLKKIFALAMVIAVVTVFSFTLVACNKDKTTYENLSAEDAYACLFDKNTGAVILMRSAINVKADFTSTEGEKSIVGTASMTDDAQQDMGLTQQAIAYSNKKITENGVTTETEYYAGYVLRLTRKGEYRKENPYYFYRTWVDGEVTEQGCEALFDESLIKPAYNNYVNDCGVYDGNEYIDKEIFDVYGEIVDTTVCSGRKCFYDGQLTGTEITVTYNYDENDANITGKFTIKIDALNRMSSLSLEESDGYTYNATYTYDIPIVLSPAREYIDNPNWVSRTEIVAEG